MTPGFIGVCIFLTFWAIYIPIIFLDSIKLKFSIKIKDVQCEQNKIFNCLKAKVTWFGLKGKWVQVVQRQNIDSTSFVYNFKNMMHSNWYFESKNQSEKVSNYSSYLNWYLKQKITKKFLKEEIRAERQQKEKELEEYYVE